MVGGGDIKPSWGVVPFYGVYILAEETKRKDDSGS